MPPLMPDGDKNFGGSLILVSNDDDDAENDAWPKNAFIFYKRNSRLSRSVRFTNGSKIVLKVNMQQRRSIPNGNTKN